MSIAVFVLFVTNVVVDWICYNESVSMSESVTAEKPVRLKIQTATWNGLVSTVKTDQCIAQKQRLSAVKCVSGRKVGDSGRDRGAGARTFERHAQGFRG